MSISVFSKFQKDGLTKLMNDSFSLYDCQLESNDGARFKSHRIVLAALSPVLEKILQYDDNPNRIFVISQLSSQDLSIVLTFIYSNKIDLSLDNVYDILVTAEYLEYLELSEICQDFIKENISDEEDAKEVLEFAQFYNITILEEKINNYIQYGQFEAPIVNVLVPYLATFSSIEDDNSTIEIIFPVTFDSMEASDDDNDNDDDENDEDILNLGMNEGINWFPFY